MSALSEESLLKLRERLAFHKLEVVYPWGQASEPAFVVRIVANGEVLSMPWIMGMPEIEAIEGDKVVWSCSKEWVVEVSA